MSAPYHILSLMAPAAAVFVRQKFGSLTATGYYEPLSLFASI
jgi:hypothetical protein